MIAAVQTVFRRNELLGLSVGMVFHPAESLKLIRNYREQFSYLPVIVILTLVLGVRVLQIYVVHFPLATIEPVDANLLLEAVRILVPFATWVVAAFAVTAILGGEALAREILLAAAYSMIPYVLMTPLIALLSRLLCRGELGLHSSLNIATWIWVAVLFLVSVRTLHGYTIGKTLWITLLTIVTMGLIWAVLILMYALTGNLRAFLEGIVREIWVQLSGSGGRL